jgi:hypothetical protein
MTDFVTFDQANDRILFAVIQKFKARAEAGKKKYGTTMDRNDLSTFDWLTHLQEELMDSIIYIEKLKQQV